MECSRLIEVLPQCAVEKLGKQTLDDMQHRYACLTLLTRKHSGELVAADQTRDYWRLVKAAPGFARANWNEQFWCFEHGEEMPGMDNDSQEVFEQWAPMQDSVQELMDKDIKAHCNDSSWQMAQLQPA